MRSFVGWRYIHLLRGSINSGLLLLLCYNRVFLWYLIFQSYPFWFLGGFSGWKFVFRSGWCGFQSTGCSAMITRSSGLSNRGLDNSCCACVLETLTFDTFSWVFGPNILVKVSWERLFI